MEPTGATQTISISCDDCDLQGSSACEDCLVSFVLGRDPDDAVVVDVEEARAMRMLSRAGLVPRLRHSRVDMDWATA
ncbi:MAG TPA: hypothetical protein VN768_06130 [Acidimicrobiales bacterium]|nr:hypothetical protein [Acidimicrobiales bacterium]